MQTTGGACKNTLDAGVKIYRNAGLRNGLYAGICAAYLRQWLYGSCRIEIYSNLLENAQLSIEAADRPKKNASFAKKLGMG
jgi:hypothetical protein